MKGGINKVGKSVQTAAASANESIQIETEYLSRKGKSDFSAAFPHDEPVLTKVKIFHAYAKHNEVKSAFERILNVEKDMLKAEEKAAKEFKEHSGTLTMCSNQQRWNQFSGAVENLSVYRKTYVDTLQKIRDDWTHTVSETHGKAHNQLERINKLHVEVYIYTKAQNRKKLEMEARKRYEDAMFDFTEAANEFIRLLDKGYLEWFDLARQAQLTFYQNCAQSVNSSYSQPVSQEVKLNYPAEIFQSYNKKHIDVPSSSSSSSSEEGKEKKEKKEKK